MSAIAKPMIHSVNTKNKISGVSPLVPVEKIKAFSPVNVPAVENSSPRFEIVFEILSTDNQYRKITWQYETEQLRDDDLADLIPFISNPISSGLSS